MRPGGASGETARHESGREAPLGRRFVGWTDGFGRPGSGGFYRRVCRLKLAFGLVRGRAGPGFKLNDTIQIKSRPRWLAFEFKLNVTIQFKFHTILRNENKPNSNFK